MYFTHRILRRNYSIITLDFIGAYTWYKKIESRSKSTLQPRREVTVVPPDQYRLRFYREVCDYFIPVPGTVALLLQYMHARMYLALFFVGKFDLVAPSNTLPSLLI